MNSLKLLFNASAVVGLCALSGQGWAGCSFRETAATASVVNIGTISVPPGATVGTLLKTVDAPHVGNSVITCTSTSYIRFQYGYGTGRTAITGYSGGCGQFRGGGYRSESDLLLLFVCNIA